MIRQVDTGNVSSRLIFRCKINFLELAKEVQTAWHLSLMLPLSKISFVTITVKKKKKKKALYLSVNIFSTKVLIGDTIFTSPNGRDRHSTWSSEPREGLAACSAKEVPSFLSHFKTLSNCPAPGIEPATSHSAVKRSTDWAIPATDKNYLPPLIHFYSLSHEDDWVKSCINNVLLNKCLNRLSIVWSRKK